jgi:hypothetical protein
MSAVRDQPALVASMKGRSGRSSDRVGVEAVVTSSDVTLCEGIRFR